MASLSLVAVSPLLLHIQKGYYDTIQAWENGRIANLEVGRLVWQKMTVVDDQGFLVRGVSVCVAELKRVPMELPLVPYSIVARECPCSRHWIPLLVGQQILSPPPFAVAHAKQVCREPVEFNLASKYILIGGALPAVNRDDSSLTRLGDLVVDPHAIARECRVAHRVVRCE